jgi:hypothetical protein
LPFVRSRRAALHGRKLCLHDKQEHENGSGSPVIMPPLVSSPRSPLLLDDRAKGVLAIYQTERQDQQTSGNQALAVTGTGLAYAAAIAAVLGPEARLTGGVDPLLIVAAPLPLVAAISFLVLNMANVQQRANYLVALERELEPYFLKPPPAYPAVRGREERPIRAPSGFRRSEEVFGHGASSLMDLRWRGSAGRRALAFGAMSALTYGVVLLVELGLIVYAVQLVRGWYVVVGAAFYGICALLQAVGGRYALSPPPGTSVP